MAYTCSSLAKPIFPFTLALPVELKEYSTNLVLVVYSLFKSSLLYLKSVGGGSGGNILTSLEE